MVRYWPSTWSRDSRDEVVNRHESDHESEGRNSPATLAVWPIVCLALLGSAWGLCELIGGATVWLTAVALLLLAVARALVNRPGSSTALATIAVLFKSVNTAPFFCHLAGIVLLGIAFDLTASLLWRDDRRPLFRAALTGAASAYLSCFLFGASMIWIFKFKHWAGGGLDRLGEYMLYSGSRGALTGLVIVPLGLWLGCLLARQATGHSRAILSAALTACLALWAIGPFIG
jgi:hypothetical protein